MLERLFRTRLRRHLTSAAVLMAVAVAFVGIFVGPVGEEPLRLQTAAALERVLPEINFNAVPASDALAFLAEQSGIPFDVDWGELRTAGVTPQTFVTARLRHMKVSKALRTVLAEMAGDGARLTFTLDTTREVCITTRDAYERQADVRRYDVRLLFPRRVSDCFPDPGSPQPRIAIPADDRMLADRMIRLIEETVDSDSWKSNGGRVGAIRMDDGWLVVRQTPENHREIERLLEQLGETRSVCILDWFGRRFEARP